MKSEQAVLPNPCLEEEEEEEEEEVEGSGRGVFYGSTIASASRD
jgi:hypothetical protein